jgi:hypothetical protein
LTCGNARRWSFRGRSLLGVVCAQRCLSALLLYEPVMSSTWPPALVGQ